MSTNSKFTAARNLRKIRKDIKARQKDLECLGIKNISELETGVKRITETVAPLLVSRINSIIEEKKLDIGYIVTEKILLGEVNIITDDILKRLREEVKKYISETTIKDIDGNIKGLNNDEAISFLLDVLSILCEDTFLNAKLIKKYSLKLLNLDLNVEIKAKAYVYKIVGHYSMEEFEEIVDLSQAIDECIDLCNDERTKVAYYSNVAMAYYKENLSEESMGFYKKLKVLGENKDEFFYLTLQADLLASNNKFNKAETMYFSILNKAQKKCNNGYIVNCYSNLADLYRRRNLLEESREFIQYALNKINSSVSDVFKFNVYFNAFLIYKDTLSKQEEFVYKAIPLGTKLNNIEQIKFLIDYMINKYIEVGASEKIYELLDLVGDTEIKAPLVKKILKSTFETL